MVATTSIPYPGAVQFSQLPFGAAVSGTEIFCVVQGGNSVQLPLASFSGVFATASVLGGLGTTALSVIGIAGTTNVAPRPITATTPNTILGLNAAGTQLAFTTIPIGLSTVVGLSIVGASGTASVIPSAITGTAGQTLRVNDAGTALGFGALNLASSAAVTGILPFTRGGLGTSGGVQSAVLGFANSTTPAFYLAGQLPGTVTNDSANAGNVGEYSSTSVLLASPVSLTTNVATTIATLSLGAGDWDIGPVIGFTGNPTTTVSYLRGSVSNTAGVIGTTVGEWSTIPCFNLRAFTTSTTTPVPSFSIGPVRRSIAATTAFYMVALAEFATSTAGAFGLLAARRAR